jgi:peptidoglycan/xylan/chitin deacetylase (PgdA/CDA1 family)
MVSPLLLSGAVAGAAAVAWTAPAGVCYTRGARLLGVRRRLVHPAPVRGAEGRIALTFDDGPQDGVTDRYLDLLGERGLRATFFVVGREAEGCPELVERMANEGHEVANHGYRHVDHLVRADVVRDVGRGADVIESITGVRPRLYRPPQGVVTPLTLAAVRRHHQTPVLWTQWARDWRRAATADSIHDEAVRVRAGGVLLLHDADHYSGRTWHATWEALPRILDTLEERGLRPGPIGGPSALA